MQLRSPAPHQLQSGVLPVMGPVRGRQNQSRWQAIPGQDAAVFCLLPCNILLSDLPVSTCVYWNPLSKDFSQHNILKIKVVSFWERMASHCPLKKIPTPCCFTSPTLSGLNLLLSPCFLLSASLLIQFHTHWLPVSLTGWFSKCGPWPSSTSISWNCLDMHILQPYPRSTEKVQV